MLCFQSRYNTIIQTVDRQGNLLVITIKQAEIQMETTIMNSLDREKTNIDFDRESM